jgi:hypothetical protein
MAVFECWYDEIEDGDETIVTASSAEQAAVLFVYQTHDGDERSHVVVRDTRDDSVTELEVTSRMEWTHTARPKGRKP